MARIFLVDDDPVIGRLVADALLNAGHAVGWVADGETALGVMCARSPHLAIVDCAMPGVSGVQLVRAMRADGRLSRVPVLMLTARTSENDEALISCRRPRLSAQAGRFRPAGRPGRRPAVPCQQGQLGGLGERLIARWSQATPPQPFSSPVAR